MSAIDALKVKLQNTDFRVRYSVESVVRIGASIDDLDAFLNSDHPQGDGTELDLMRHFFAWCIGEDGCDFDEREMPEVLEVLVGFS